MERAIKIKRYVISLIFGFLMSGFLIGGALSEAYAGPSSAFEISLGLSYDRSKYSEESYSWTRRWGLSVGFHLTVLTELEFSLQDAVVRNHIVDYEDTTRHDRIYSLSVIQNLMSRHFPVQPYVKAGVGQLNRDAEGVYAGGGKPTSHLDSVTGVLGVGLRLYLTPRFAVRAEATSYLTGGNIGTYKDNIASSLGISYFF